MFTNQLIVSLFWSLKLYFDCCLFDILHRKYACMFTALLKQQLDHHIPAVTRFCNAFSNKHFEENRTILVCQADTFRFFCLTFFCLMFFCVLPYFFTFFYFTSFNYPNRRVEFSRVVGGWRSSDFGDLESWAKTIFRKSIFLSYVTKHSNWDTF